MTATYGVPACRPISARMECLRLKPVVSVETAIPAHSTLSGCRGRTSDVRMLHVSYSWQYFLPGNLTACAMGAAERGNPLNNFFRRLAAMYRSLPFFLLPFLLCWSQTRGPVSVVLARSMNEKPSPRKTEPRLEKDSVECSDRRVMANLRAWGAQPHETSTNRHSWRYTVM